MPIDDREALGCRRLCWPLLAGAAFLGFLGSTELWGKREQRASAEALDTVDHGRWLVAQIQGRPRLEKPPLPRWITACLMIGTGRRDEAIVRLPNALAALATVALVYWLGRGLGGRSVGLASGFALASSAYFLVEMRQAGNDGLLALFTTLALLAAWKRLHGNREGYEVEPPGDLRAIAAGLRLLPGVGPRVPHQGACHCVDGRAGGRGLPGDGPTVSVRDCGSWLMDGAWRCSWFWLWPGRFRFWSASRRRRGSGGWRWPRRRGRWRSLTIRSASRSPLDWFWMTLPWTPLALVAATLAVLPDGSRARRLKTHWSSGRRAWTPFGWWWAIGGRLCWWWSASASGRSPSRAITCRACLAWRCWSGRSGSA